MCDTSVIRLVFQTNTSFCDPNGNAPSGTTESQGPSERVVQGRKPANGVFVLSLQERGRDNGDVIIRAKISASRRRRQRGGRQDPRALEGRRPRPGHLHLERPAVVGEVRLRAGLSACACWFSASGRGVYRAAAQEARAEGITRAVWGFGCVWCGERVASEMDNAYSCELRPSPVTAPSHP